MTFASGITPMFMWWTGDYPGVPNQITQTLEKAYFFSELATAEEVKEIKGLYLRERILSTAGFEDGGNCMSRNVSDV